MAKPATLADTEPHDDDKATRSPVRAAYPAMSKPGASPSCLYSSIIRS